MIDRLKWAVLKLSPLLLFFVSISASAQPGDPGGDPDAVPISGLGALLLAGGLLGFQKVRKAFKNR